ncbi:MAG: pyridine nucleotide-disulfide oxidoreductase [Desulfurivibrio sp.]|nr:MAG: pyridine nucleotide-disulfide oxidoreductase [Desulfurivibrio sp.]
MAGLATSESLVVPDAMLKDAGVTVIRDRVTGIDSEKKNVTLAGGQVLSFDKLLLANGADPVLPPLPGRDLRGIFTLRSTPDAEAMLKFMQERKPRNLTVIGAGFIGLEVGSLLKQAQPDLQVTVVEFLHHPLPVMLDADMAAKVASYLTEQGMDLRTGVRVTGISGKDGYASGVELDSGDVTAADMVIMSVGAKSNFDLARQAGLAIGEFGIKVNEYMETSHPDIFAAGDNVENKCLVTGQSMPGQLRGTAVCQGRLVAKRLKGAAIPFPGVLNNSCVKLFDLCAASVGLTEENAKKQGIKTACFTVDSRSKHGMIKGMKPWTLKVVFNTENRKVIGSQIVSMSEAMAKEIDVMNMAIKMGAVPEDLLTINCAGHPDLSSEPSLEPISIAGLQASGKI